MVGRNLNTGLLTADPGFYFILLVLHPLCLGEGWDQRSCHVYLKTNPASCLRREPLIYPVALPSVSDRVQGCAAVLEMSEDDAVMQAVGLALPELYDFWL